MTRLILEGEMGDGTKVVVREEIGTGLVRIWFDGVEVHDTKFIKLA